MLRNVHCCGKWEVMRGGMCVLATYLVLCARHGVRVKFTVGHKLSDKDKGINENAF